MKTPLLKKIYAAVRHEIVILAWILTGRYLEGEQYNPTTWDGEPSHPTGRNRVLPLLCFAALALCQTAAKADSLWHDDSGRSMVADKRAAAVGDILTVLVQENSTATKKNSTSTSKNNAQDASVSTFLYGAGSGAAALLSRGGQMPALKYSSKNTFDGGGSIDNSQNLVASVAVKVIDVLPNRCLVIEGRRETAFSGEKQSAVLHGIVRPEDIFANNTVYSYNIADAKVEIVSKGVISDNQRRGWFSYIWNKVTPF